MARDRNSDGILEFRNLTKVFDNKTWAVNDVSLSVPAGQMVGIIGPSGAGKSTLLRLINRLINPTDGTISYGGVNVGALRRRALLVWRARCAMIFQQFGLVKRSTALTNVLLGRLRHKAVWATLLGVFTKSERRRAVELLSRFDVHTIALQRADTLSGGQMQRVAIAKALMQDPDIVLADEPIASLDPRSSLQVMQALRRINQEDGLTVLCNLHNVQIAKDFCDRIVAMQDGRVVFDGTPEQLTETMIREIYGMQFEEIEDEIKRSTEMRQEPVNVET